MVALQRNRSRIYQTNLSQTSLPSSFVSPSFLKMPNYHRYLHYITLCTPTPTSGSDQSQSDSHHDGGVDRNPRPPTGPSTKPNAAFQVVKSLRFARSEHHQALRSISRDGLSLVWLFLLYERRLMIGGVGFPLDWKN